MTSTFYAIILAFIYTLHVMRRYPNASVWSVVFAFIVCSLGMFLFIMILPFALGAFALTLVLQLIYESFTRKK